MWYYNQLLLIKIMMGMTLTNILTFPLQILWGWSISYSETKYILIVYTENIHDSYYADSVPFPDYSLRAGINFWKLLLYWDWDLGSLELEGKYEWVLVDFVSFTTQWRQKLTHDMGVKARKVSSIVYDQTTPG